MRGAVSCCLGSAFYVSWSAMCSSYAHVLTAARENCPSRSTRFSSQYFRLSAARISSYRRDKKLRGIGGTRGSQTKGKELKNPRVFPSPVSRVFCAIGAVKWTHAREDRDRATFLTELFFSPSYDSQRSGASSWRKKNRQMARATGRTQRPCSLSPYVRDSLWHERET